MNSGLAGTEQGPGHPRGKGSTQAKVVWYAVTGTKAVTVAVTA